MHVGHCTGALPATGGHALCKSIGGHVGRCSLAGDVLCQELRLGRAATGAVYDKRNSFDVVVPVYVVGLVDPFLILFLGCDTFSLQHIASHPLQVDETPSDRVGG